MKVFLAGRVAVETDGVVLDESRFPGRQGRLFFAYLVAEHGRAVPRDELGDALWHDALPATWDKALTVIASKLRALLAEHGANGRSVLTAAFGCYRLELPDETWIDVIEAANAVNDAETALAADGVADAKAKAALADSVLRKPFLPGEHGAWIEEKRREFTNLRARALDASAEACLRAGELREAAEWAEQAIALEPFREAGYRQLMEAHAMGGNRAEALRVYERCRRLLKDELGAYPSPETESIYRRLLDAPPVEVPREPSIVRTGRRPIVLALGIAAAVTIAAAAFLLTRSSGSTAVAAIRPDSIVTVDPHRNTPVADIALHSRPAAVAYGAGSLWVATEDDQTLLQIDPTTHHVARTIGLGVEPRAVAADGRYIWVLATRANLLLEFDADTGTRVRTIRPDWPIRTGPFAGHRAQLLQPAMPLDFHLTAGGGAAWVGLGYDVVARIDSKSGVTGQIRAGSSGGVAFGNHALWSIGGPFDGPRADQRVFRIDVRTHTVTAIPSVSGFGHGIAAGADGAWAFTANNNRLWKIDADLARVDATVPLEHSPVDVAVGAAGVWIANGDGTVSRLDAENAAVVKTIQLGRYPRRAYPVGLTTGDGLLWVAVH